MKALLVGDVSPTAISNPLFAEKNLDALFGKEVQALFKGNDINFVNLEVALTDSDKGIEKFGEMCHENGLWLLYHNHDFEFEKTADGRYVLDYMYETIKPECLGAEPDTCWVNIGGEDPASYIRKYAGRCPVVHLKDFVGSKTENMYALIGTDEAKQEKSDAFAFRPLGQGKQNFPEILKASIESGAEYVIVEQDDTNEIPCLEAAKISRDYLKELGW